MVTELTRLSAHGMARALRVGDVSSRELAIAHLDAAERQNHAMNAWLTIDREAALAQAEAADATLARRRAEGGEGFADLHPLHEIGRAHV